METNPDMNFNENPFAKDTPVIPFSNGTSAMIWQEHNCFKCIKYEGDRKSEDEAKCKLAYNLDLGFILGTIELWVAKEIGCEYVPLYQSCKLDGECRQFRTGDEPF